MRYLFQILIISFFFLGETQKLHADEKCNQALLSYIKEKNPEFIEKFFQLQTKLTLHRLAWAYLHKVGEKESLYDQSKFEVENVIRDTLTQLEGSEKEEWLNAFMKHPYSRKSLSDLFEKLKPVLEEQNKLEEKNHKFAIHSEDISMISLLSEGAPGSSFTHKTNHVKASNIVNLLKLVRSAYLGKSIEQLKSEKEGVEIQLKKLSEENDENTQFLMSLQKNLAECKSESESCTDCNQNRFIELFKDSLIESQFKGVRYGEIWLRTRYKAISERELSDRLAPEKSGTEKIKPSVSKSPKMINKPSQSLEEQLNRDKIKINAFILKVDPLLGYKNKEEFQKNISVEKRKKDVLDFEKIQKLVKDLNDSQSCFKTFKIFKSQAEYQNLLKQIVVKSIIYGPVSLEVESKNYGSLLSSKSCSNPQTSKLGQNLIESNLRLQQLNQDQKCHAFSPEEKSFLSTSIKDYKNIIQNHCQINLELKESLNKFKIYKKVIH